MPKEKIQQELNIISAVFVVLVTIINLICVALLIMGFSGSYIGADGNYYVMGYASWGRLYGIYIDPNYGAVISCVAIVALLVHIQKARKFIFKVLIVLSLVINICYCAFSASRTGKIALFIGVSVYFFVLFFKIAKFKSFVKAVSLAFCIGIFSVLILNGVVKGYNTINHFVYSSIADNLNDNNVSDKDDNKTETIIGRDEEDLSGDVSNRRFDIWKSGVDIFKTAPVLGIGWSNVLEYTAENLPDSYMMKENNNFADFDIFHNSLIDVFVFQGLFGAIIMLLLMVYTVISLVNLAFKNKIETVGIELIFGMLAVCVFSGCVLSVLFYFNNIISYIFWLSMGYVFYYYESKKKIADITK